MPEIAKDLVTEDSKVETTKDVSTTVEKISEEDKKTQENGVSLKEEEQVEESKKSGDQVESKEKSPDTTSDINAHNHEKEVDKVEEADSSSLKTEEPEPKVSESNNGNSQEADSTENNSVSDKKKASTDNETTHEVQKEESVKEEENVHNSIIKESSKSEVTSEVTSSNSKDVQLSKSEETETDLKENNDEKMDEDKHEATEKVEFIASSSAASEKTESDAMNEINEMINEGRICLNKRNFTGAADHLGLACEKLRELYGELDDRCGPCYYYYGWAMLECAKRENSVLGEAVNKETNESEEEEDDEEIPLVTEKKDESDKLNGVAHPEEVNKENVDDEKKVNGDISHDENEKPEGDEKMETDENDENEDSEEGDDDDEEDGDDQEPDVGESTLKEEEDEDTTLKAAWEILELAKVIFEKLEDSKMLADTYMKLGEVAVESGHQEGIDDMKKCLDLRKVYYSENHRAIPETHFNIGLSYSTFELFDDAIDHFTITKSLLQKRIDFLEKEGPDAADEVKEIKDLFPEIDEKIKDMKDSKVEKSKAADQSLNKETSNSESGESSNKAVTNLTHLVKRKRKLEDVASDQPEKAVKQPCIEEGS